MHTRGTDNHTESLCVLALRSNSRRVRKMPRLGILLLCHCASSLGCILTLACCILACMQTKHCLSCFLTCAGVKKVLHNSGQAMSQHLDGL